MILSYVDGNTGLEERERDLWGRCVGVEDEKFRW